MSICGKNIRLSAQNMYLEDERQFTGEISLPILKEIGVDIVEISHSKRWHVFGESDIEENKRYSQH